MDNHTRVLFRILDTWTEDNHWFRLSDRPTPNGVIVTYLTPMGTMVTVLRSIDGYVTRIESVS